MKISSIESHRRSLREVDARIVRLLNERALISAMIGRAKAERGLDVLDAAQEAKLFEYLRGLNGGSLPEKHLKAIFREIISASRALQKPVSAAFLGPDGTFSHIAARSFFGASTAFVPEATIFNVFEAVEKGKVEWGIVPVENSLEGSVNLTLDRLIETPLKVQAEIFLRIRHCLLARGTRIDKIKRVYSVPQALAQCQGWLRSKLPNIMLCETESTAAAAMSAQKERNGAAIASRLAAATYGLHMLADGIEDNPGNTTRFFVVGQGEAGATGKDKTSVLFGTPHAPGALYHALEPFVRRRINLLKIESYPIKERLWEYLFFVDFEGHREDGKIKNSMKALKGKINFLKILGSYPKGEEAQ
ncbi:MAG TPA: prephenate dehydratase [Syntrophales bacterium]|nr:prephenate dehydratase [Syntrophales bacterium]